MLHQQPPEAARPNSKKGIKVLLFLFVCMLLGTVAFVYLSYTGTNANFPITLTVREGSSVSAIVRSAKEANLVRFELPLYILLTYKYDPHSIYAGTYVFSEKSTVDKVAEKLAGGDIESQVIRLTIPEGISRKEIAKIAEEVLSDFDKEAFLHLTKGKEGYLFPETYFIPQSYSAEQVATLLLKTYDEKSAELDYTSTTLAPEEVLILASIVEREANDETSMGMVSGILQNRLRIGMALQADASMEYVLDKPLKELTPEDLKIDTPYNTYRNTGLPPTPIGNPGLRSLHAVLKPTQSDYLFYITGNDGTFYYAETYPQHLKNISLYLR